MGMRMRNSIEIEQDHDWPDDDVENNDIREAETFLPVDESQKNRIECTKNSRDDSIHWWSKPFLAVYMSLTNESSIFLNFFIVIFLISGMIPILMNIAPSFEKNYSQLNDSINSSYLLYQCSSNTKTISTYKSANDKEDAFVIYDQGGIDDSETLDIKNLTQFLQEDFDGRNTNYFEFKKDALKWKLNTFGRNLKNGDTIYESACGIGVNLLATLQVLEENLGITNLTVYGNDYLEESVNVANKVLDASILSLNQRVIQGLGTKIGSICWGDSTNLEFVPSDAFDLVFTGYIDPIVDPLNLGTNLTHYREKTKTGILNCKSKDPEKQDLAKEGQKVQEDWFASWVKEMIRITKPGKIIIVEEVSLPLCNEVADRGGVDKAWWSQAILDYGWNVHPNIYIEETTRRGRYHDGRYNVMLRKIE